jgi:membrane-associated phospholipid phosphatase
LIRLLKHNSPFLVLHLLFLIAGAYIIAQYEHGSEILYANALHTNALNKFFLLATKIAEGPGLILALLIALYSAYGKGLLMLINILATSGLVQFLKHIVFSNQLRPAEFFKGTHELIFIPGLEMARYNSFPSGHTAAAFAMFFTLSLFAKNKYWGLLYFTLALLVGISRVYLMQHFFRDVYVGSAIGVFVPALLWLTFAQSNLYQNIKWRDKSLFKNNP